MSGKKFPVINPATGEKICDVEEGDKVCDLSFSLANNWFCLSIFQTIID